MLIGARKLMVKSAKHSRRIVEQVFGLQNELGQRIDEGAGVIRGVKILGINSKNVGRVLGLTEQEFGDAVNRSYAYDPAALRSARPMYEGTSVYSNHLEFDYDETGRRYAKQEAHHNEDLVGWLQDVRFVDGQGLFADLHYLTRHSFAPVLVEIANRRPDKIALSHEASFDDPTLIDGRIVLGKISDVECVCLVNQRPGTTNGLFEMAARKEGTMRTIREILESAPEGTKGRMILKQVVEAMPAMGDLQVAVPEATAAGVDDSPENQIRTGLLAAVNTGLDKASPEQLRAVLKVLGLSDSLSETCATKKPEIMETKDEQNQQCPGDGQAAVPAEAPAEAPAEPAAPTETPDAKGQAPAEGEQPAAPAAPAEVPPEEEQKKKARVPESESSQAVNLVLECVSILTEQGLQPRVTILESMLALPTVERRRQYAAEMAEAAAPVTDTFLPRSQGTVRKAAEAAPAPEYTQKGSLAEAFRRVPVTAN
jgi:hypothetical protein